VIKSESTHCLNFCEECLFSETYVRVNEANDLHLMNYEKNDNVSI